MEDSLNDVAFYLYVVFLATQGIFLPPPPPLPSRNVYASISAFTKICPFERLANSTVPHQMFRLLI